MLKEEWINRIMQSSADINSAEPNPYLFNKIMMALEQPRQRPSSGTLLKWAFAAIFFVGINVAGISFISSSQKQQNHESALNSLSTEMEYNTTYNY